MNEQKEKKSGPTETSIQLNKCFIAIGFKNNLCFMTHKTKGIYIFKHFFLRTRAIQNVHKIYIAEKNSKKINFMPGNIQLEGYLRFEMVMVS